MPATTREWELSLCIGPFAWWGSPKLGEMTSGKKEKLKKKKISLKCLPLYLANALASALLPLAV
jgi:hypothetical protein